MQAIANNKNENKVGDMVLFSLFTPIWLFILCVNIVCICAHCFRPMILAQSLYVYVYYYHFRYHYFYYYYRFL